MLELTLGLNSTPEPIKALLKHVSMQDPQPEALGNLFAVRLSESKRIGTKENFSKSDVRWKHSNLT